MMSRITIVVVAPFVCIQFLAIDAVAEEAADDHGIYSADEAPTEATSAAADGASVEDHGDEEHFFDEAESAETMDLFNVRCVVLLCAYVLTAFGIIIVCISRSQRLPSAILFAFAAFALDPLTELFCFYIPTEPASSADRIYLIVSLLANGLGLALVAVFACSQYRGPMETRSPEGTTQQKPPAPLADASIPMHPRAKEIPIVLAFDSAVLNVSSQSGVEDDLRNAFAKRLRASGHVVAWKKSGHEASIVLRVIEIDQGNQFLRWLAPFLLGAARIDVEGHCLDSHERRHEFHFCRRACISVFGGSSRYMVRVCADRIAQDFRNWITAKAS